MNRDYTDITVVLDRSGSMQSCREEAETGLNAFVDDQRKLPGKVAFSLVQFDDAYTPMCSAVPIKDVGRFELVPRGMTALLDAVGRTIDATGRRLEAMKEEDRPGLVVFVILTDGQENASKEYTPAKVREMVQHQEKCYSWKFMFLAKGLDAFMTGMDQGGYSVNTASSFVNTKAAFKAASGGILRAATASAGGSVPDCSYTDEERKEMAKS